ncbi:MAG: fumarylacetoacetate hydrolase family protein [Pseudomonadota bacterium]
MIYQHQWQDGSPVSWPVGKVVCVGRNYAAHARELGNAVPEAPILFLKPATALVPLGPDFAIPSGRGSCHHETEISLLIGSTLTGQVSAPEARAAIAGITLGLDLTLRDVQNQLKQQGHPWEVAKAFDGAAPMAAFAPLPATTDLADLCFTLTVNGGVRQQGHSEDMITGIVALLQFIATIFTLQPGDVVMTGTPEGVAALNSGDELVLALGEQSWATRVR